MSSLDPSVQLSELGTIVCKAYHKIGMGPLYTPPLKNLEVITDFLSEFLIFFQKPGFKSGLDFWKLGLEGSKWKNKATITLNIMSFSYETGLIFSIFGLYCHFWGLESENRKNKATFITDPQKVFIVKVALFFRFDPSKPNFRKSRPIWKPDFWKKSKNYAKKSVIT